MKLTMALLSAVILVSSLSACNTVEGFGQDVQKGGDAIERSAERNK